MVHTYRTDEGLSISKGFIDLDPETREKMTQKEIPVNIRTLFWVTVQGNPSNSAHYIYID